MKRISAEELRRLRGHSSWSQAELAKKAGLNQATVANIETGKAQAGPHASQALYKAFGILKENPVDEERFCKNEMEYNLLKYYRVIPPGLRKHLYGMFEYSAQQHAGKTDKESLQAKSPYLKYYNEMEDE